MLLDRCADAIGGQSQLVDQKPIGMAGADSMGRQDWLREIVEVEGEDEIGSALDGGGQDMAVFRVRQLQGWDEGLLAIDQCIPHMGIHQRAGELQLLPGKIRSVPQHRPDPFLMDCIAPAGAIEILERQTQQQITKWGRIENTGVVQDGEAIHLSSPCPDLEPGRSAHRGL